MRLSTMFITAICVIFLRKPRWPKKKEYKILTSSDAFSSTLFPPQHSDLFMFDEEGCFIALSKFKEGGVDVNKIDNFSRRLLLQDSG